MLLLKLIIYLHKLENNEHTGQVKCIIWLKNTRKEKKHENKRIYKVNCKG